MSDPTPADPPAGRHPFLWTLVALGLLCLPVLIFVGVRHIFRVVESPVTTPSVRRLQLIGGALAQYTRDHGGAYPPTLDALAQAEGLPADTPVCPPGPTPAAGGPFRYVYLGGGQTDQTTTNGTAVAYEPMAFNGGTGGHVLYGDGTVIWASAAALPDELAQGRPPAGARHDVP